MFNPISLREKKIIVFGASSGIGRSTAIYCSKLGASVIICGRNGFELEKTFSQLSGDGHMKIECSFNDKEIVNCESVFLEAVSDFKKLDGLVYSVGVSDTVPLRVLKMDVNISTMLINYCYFVEVCRLFAKNKFSNGGSIVGISSSASIRANKGQIAYAASKAAMDSAVQVMSLELIDKKIRVNSVQPSLVRTKMYSEMERQGVNISNLEIPPLGIAEPIDVASVCAFLLSDMSKMITGRNIPVDGGR